MAKNPYTQDITPTVEAVRKANTPSYASQLIDIFQTYAKNHESRAKENIDNLQTDFVFEKQSLNSRIKDYNKIMEKQTDIRDNYGGSIEAYASAEVNKEYKNRVGTHYNMLGQEGWRIIDDYTDVVSRDYLKAKIANRVKKYEKLFKTASTVTLGTDVDETYVDDLFSSEINKLPDTVRGGGWGLLGNLIAGQGLKVGQDYSVTREDILKRVYSDIPNKELGELAEDFKSLYIDDKVLAKQLVDEILPNKQVGTTFNIVKNDITQTFMGQEIRGVETYMTYIDHNGQPQMTKPVRRSLNEGELFFDAKSMSDFRKYYNDKGLKIWKEEHDKGTPLSEIVKILNSDMDNLKNPYEDEIKKTWTTPTPALMAIYESFLVSNGFAEVGALGQSQITMKEDASEMQGYMSYDQFIKDSMNKQLKTLGVETTEIFGNSIPVLSANKLPLAYTVDDNSFNTTAWKDSIRGTNPVITNDNDKKITLIENLLGELELDTGPKLADLQQEFENGDFTNVNSLGLFWNKENPYILTTQELFEIGVEDATEPMQFGYNIETDEFVMRSTTAFRTEPEEEEETEVVGKDIVQKFNEVPYVGAVSELLFGEDLDAVDAVWLLSGGIGIKVIGKYTFKKSLQIAGGKMFTHKTTLAAIKKIRDIKARVNRVPITTRAKIKSGPNKGNWQTVNVKHKYGPKKGQVKYKNVPDKLHGFKTQKQLDKWYDGLTDIEKAVYNSMNNAGNVSRNEFITQFGQMKTTRVMAYVPTVGKIVTYGAAVGVPAAAQYYSRSTEAGRAEALDH